MNASEDPAVEHRDDFLSKIADLFFKSLDLYSFLKCLQEDLKKEQFFTPGRRANQPSARLLKDVLNW